MNAPPYKNVKLISPEEIQVDVKYTLTLCPDDSLQFWNANEIQRLERSQDYIRSLLLNLGKNTDINIWLEVSRTGRIHYHGTIMFASKNSVKTFFLTKIHKIQDHFKIEIDTISDMDEWLDYCQKSFDLWNIKITTKDAIKYIKNRDNFCTSILQYFN